MTEQWTRWEPIPGLAKKYDIHVTEELIEGFHITLVNEVDKTEQVVISFEPAVSAYKSTQEGFRLKLIRDLDEKYGGEFYSEWTFFKVDNSEYLNWLAEQSLGILDLERDSFMHFSLITSDSILDIVANYEPRVEVHRM